MVVTKKDPIVAWPLPPDGEPDPEPDPPALPWRAVLAGLACALAIGFFAAVGREFVMDPSDAFDALPGGFAVGMAAGVVVRCLGGRGFPALHFVFWIVVGGAMLGNVVGGYWDFAYGCRWAEPTGDLAHAIGRRFDLHFFVCMAGAIVASFGVLLAPSPRKSGYGPRREIE